jgi:hypothetical protein
MKKIVFFFILISLLFNFFLGQDQADKEKEAIKKAIMNYYHEGHVKSDPSLYEKVLHEEWKIFYLDKNGRLKTADKTTYMSWYDPKKVDKTLKWKTEFFYIDVSKYLASVKLKIKNQKFGYIDYFNLMKIDGKWWIVHKISHSL